MKFGLLGSHSTVPRDNPKSKGLLVKLGLLSPEQTTRRAGGTTVAKAVGEDRSPGTAKRSALTASALALASDESGSSRLERRTRPTPTLQHSPGLLVKLGVLVSQSTAPRQNPISRCLLMKLGLLESKSRVPRQNLVSQCPLMKLGLLESTSRVPRQNPISQCPLVKLGLYGLEQMAGTVPAFQQSQCLLVKLGLLKSQSRVPRRNLNSQSLLMDTLLPMKMSSTSCFASWSRLLEKPCELEAENCQVFLRQV